MYVYVLLPNDAGDEWEMSLKEEAGAGCEPTLHSLT